MNITVHGLRTNKKAYLTSVSTPKAYLVSVYTLGEYKEVEELWLPKSQVEIDKKADTIDVSQWCLSSVLKAKVY